MVTTTDLILLLKATSVSRRMERRSVECRVVSLRVITLVGYLVKVKGMMKEGFQCRPSQTRRVVCYIEKLMDFNFVARIENVAGIYLLSLRT